MFVAKIIAALLLPLAVLADEGTTTCIQTDTPTPLPVKTTINTLSTSKIPTATYQACGGHVVSPRPCPTGYTCMDDLRKGGCGMACDAMGICVQPTFCGGFAGLPCPRGKRCFDDPRDRCDPKRGGADCGGICI